MPDEKDYCRSIYRRRNSFLLPFLVHACRYHRTTNTLKGVLSGMFPNEAATETPLVAYTTNNTYEYM